MNKITFISNIEVMKFECVNQIELCDTQMSYEALTICMSVMVFLKESDRILDKINEEMGF